MDVNTIVSFIERLNLATPKSFVGSYFDQMLAILAIVFGGSFLLFAYKHYAYFSGVTGFLLGGWLGLMIKNQYYPEGAISPAIYMGASAVAGACIAVYYERLVGIMLGGFTILSLVYVFTPELFTHHPNQNLTFGLLFLLGGGLGALFSKFFFIFNTSLIGAIFATHGISLAIVAPLVHGLTPQWNVMVHLLIFVPLLLFGMLYQFITTRDTDGPPVARAPQQQIVINAR